MPELPEVEVVRQGLAAHILGYTVQGAEVRAVQIVLTSQSELNHRLVGQDVLAIRRRGKYLLLAIGQETLLIHLRMTGQLTVHDPSRSDAPGFVRQAYTGLQRTRQHAIDKHTHFILTFTNGKALYYRDTRKFGRIELLTPAQLKVHPGLLKLGVEPLESAYTWSYFQTGIKGQRSIKALLLDQRFVAGLGNIYCDEALLSPMFDLNVQPRASLQAEQKAPFSGYSSRIAKGIDFGGTTFRDYLNSDGQAGSHQDELWVYGRKDQPCLTCGTPIVKTVVAQRGTHYCPACQR